MQNRREFIGTLGAATALLMIGKLPASDLPEGFQAVRGDIGLYSNRGGTIAYLKNDEGLVVVDAQFIDTAKIFWKGLRGGLRRINFLINTHHHGDHTNGNFFLKDFADKIVAQKNVPSLQKNAAVARENLDQQAYPDTLFESEWSTETGGEKIHLRHIQPAHTGGDAIIHFQNTNIAHMGDLVFNRLPAYIDLKAGASIEGWIDVLHQHYDHFDTDTILIYGHGNPEFGIQGSREDLKVMAEFLDGLLNYAKKQVAEGVAVEKAGAIEKLPGFPDHYSAEWQGAIGNCVRAAYQELTKS